MTLNSGEMVSDRYRIVQLLGQGGMGAVYRAWDIRLERPVALKEMIPQVGIAPHMLKQLRQQFQQEAQILASLNHPGLVRVTDHFSWRNNAYLVMDFVEGESLATRIKREGAQPDEQVLDWAAQLLDALGYCHQQGVFHRDIKPHNIIITPEGKVHLVDFGLVKLWNPDDPQTRTVMRGAGTPEYAPPEQYDVGMSYTDRRSDIYSLGATLYHALTGQVPPTATKRMANPASFLPPRRMNAAVSPATEAAILKALEISMDARFRETDEMARALRLQDDRSMQPAMRSPAPSSEAPVKMKRKKGIWLGLGGVGLAAICLVATGIAIILGLRFLGDESNGNEVSGISPTPPDQVAITPAAQTEHLIFQDDFEDEITGWEIGAYETGSVGYKNGAYAIISANNGSTMWGVANRTFDDVVVDVDVTQISAGPESNNDLGVVCREQGDGSGYYLLISGDGYAAILKAANGQFEWLREWEETSAVRQGNATNRLRAVCDGPTLTLFVNGQQVATIQDSSFRQGDLAFTATTYEDDPTEIHFDNLKVRNPSTLEE